MSLEHVLFGAAIANRQVLHDASIHWKDPSLLALIELMRAGTENDEGSKESVSNAFSAVTGNHLQRICLLDGENVLGAFMRAHASKVMKSRMAEVADKISKAVFKLQNIGVLNDEAAEREEMIILAKEIETLARS